MNFCQFIKEFQEAKEDKNDIIHQLKMGVDVEKEHTDDPIERIKIAIDHLKEDPEYYTKLKLLNL